MHKTTKDIPIKLLIEKDLTTNFSYTLSVHTRLIEAKIGYAIYCLGSTNFDAHIYRGNRKILSKETKLVPSLSLIYCNNYCVVDVAIKTIKNRSILSLLLNVSSLFDVKNG